MHYKMIIKANSWKDVENKMKAFEIFGANGTESKYVKEIDITDDMLSSYKSYKEKEENKDSFKEYCEWYNDYESFPQSTDMNEVDVEDKKWGYIIVDENENVVKVIKRDNPNGNYDYYSLNFPFSAYYIKNGVSFPFGIESSNENHVSLEDFYNREIREKVFNIKEGISVSDIDLTNTYNYLYKKCRHEYDTLKAMTKGLKYKPLEHFIKKHGLTLEDYAWSKEEYKPAIREHESQEFYIALRKVVWNRDEYKDFDQDLYSYPLIMYTWSFEKYFEYKRNAFFRAYGYIYRSKWITDYDRNRKYSGEKNELKRIVKWTKEIHNFIFNKEKNKKIFILDIHR